MNEAPAPLGGCEVHDLASDVVGDTFRVFVGHCHGAAAVDVPVVVVTDANGSFGMTVDIVRHLQLGGHLPPLLVVGIGYPVDTLRDAIPGRVRDLTPTVSPAMKGADGVVLPSGGAPAFLSFLVDELLPWVDARFPVSDDRTYLGHSLGGLFGTYAMFERASTFRSYALASPSCWWDDHEILRREASYAGAHADLVASLVVTIGEHETSAGRTAAAAQLPEWARPTLVAPRDMVRDAEVFVDALAGRGYPGLDVRFRVLPGEHHATVPPIAVSHSLRVVFGAPGHADLVPRHVGPAAECDDAAAPGPAGPVRRSRSGRPP